MRNALRRPGLTIWLGGLLCAVAVVALAVPATAYVRALNGTELALGRGPHVLQLPADTTYGIYVNDQDNSGYTENCSIRDADGNGIALEGPPWTITASETQRLDAVYNTGSGDLTINCSVPNEQVSTRPVPNTQGLLLGILLAGTLACAGIALLIIPIARRPSSLQPLGPPPVSPHSRP